jgi:hydrogenase-4 component B
MIAEIFFMLMMITTGIGALSSLILQKFGKANIWSAFTATIIAAIFGIISASTVLIDQGFTINLIATSFGIFEISIDKLSAFFIIIISVLTIPVSIYSMDYIEEYRGEYNIGYMGFLYNLFFLSMILVVVATNAIFFLVAWEIMSLVSYLLVIYENRKKETISAGTLYVVMTHFGTGFIIIAFFILGSFAGDFSFTSFATIGSTLPVEYRNLLFIFLLIGFGTKAGIMPLHVWLPSAHPAAPSNVSSLMSGVMIKTAILMLIRFVFDIFGVVDTWWGLLFIIIGCISALFGVLYALVERNIKQILAYSSIENIGIIFIGLGTAMVFQAVGLIQFSSLALIATILHVFNHSLFKGLLFMGAGAIIHATHSKNIEDFGGLIKKLPKTSIFFFVGVLSICAIPPFNGFISEWLIIQSMLSSFNIADTIIQIIFPIALGVLALVGGLAIACFIRLFGITFLALPRSKHAEEAKEVPKKMQIGMGIVAFLCLITGVLASLILLVIDQVVSSITGVSIAAQLVSGIVIFPINPNFVDVSPILIAILLTVLIFGAFYASKKIGGKQKVEIGDSWDCGTPINSRNEYTGTAFSMPINRVFGGLLRPKSHIKIVPSVSPYIFKEKTFISEEKELIFEKYLYIPVVNSIKSISSRLKRIQNGNILAYLLYIFITLVVLLIFVR